MKKILKENIIFIIFAIIMIVLNLMLVSIQNYDNIILQAKYDRDVEMNLKPDLEYYQMLDNKSKIENSEKFINNTSKVILIPSIIFLIIFLFCDFEKMNKEKIFLIVFIPIALMYTFIVPIGGVPDENAHWYRSYEISLGNLYSEKDAENKGGRVLPKEIKSVLTYDYKSGTVDTSGYVFEDSYKDWKIRYDEALKKEQGEEFIEFSNTALYPAVCYFPQALGIAISRCFTSSVMVQAYCARLVNLIFYTLIMWYSIKKLPFKKMAMFVIACLPVVFQEAASMSIDGTLTAFATLLISYTLYLTYDENKKELNFKDYIILIISAIFTAITKIVYLPICLILYLIPKEKFKNSRFENIIGLIIIFFTMAPMILDRNKNRVNIKERILKVIINIIKIIFLPITLLLTLVSKFVPKEKIKNINWKYIIVTSIFLIVTILDLSIIVSSLSYENSIASPEADTFAQLKNILSRPIQFCLVILATIKKFGVEHILSIFGNNLSWLDINISPVYVLSLLLIALYYIVCDNTENDKIKASTKIWSGILSIFVIAAILVTEYLTITAYGYFYILGIQGRYFVPILILICLAFSNNIIIKKGKGLPLKYLLMFLILANLHTLTYFMYKYL